MENSPLAKLPSELRNEIYEFALTQDTAIAISAARRGFTRRGFQQRDGCQYKHLLSLALTCHAIRSGSLALLYACNTFVFDSYDPSCRGLTAHIAEKFLESIGPKNASSVAKIHIKYTEDYVYMTPCMWTPANYFKSQVVTRIEKYAIGAQVYACLAPQAHIQIDLPFVLPGVDDFKHLLQVSPVDVYKSYNDAITYLENRLSCISVPPTQDGLDHHGDNIRMEITCLGRLREELEKACSSLHKDLKSSPLDHTSEGYLQLVEKYRSPFDRKIHCRD